MTRERILTDEEVLDASLLVSKAFLSDPDEVTDTTRGASSEALDRILRSHASARLELTAASSAAADALRSLAEVRRLLASAYTAHPDNGDCVYCGKGACACADGALAYAHVDAHYEAERKTALAKSPIAWPVLQNGPHRD